MHIPIPFPNDDAEDAHAGAGDDEALFAETARRMSQRRLAPCSEALPAEAIRGLSASAHPINRYLSNRRARPKTMRDYKLRLRTAALMLVEAGFDEGADSESIYEFPWHRITVFDADAFYQLVAKRYPNMNTRASLLYEVRAVLRQCVRSELLDRRTLDQLIDALPVNRPDNVRVGREIQEEEIEALQRAAAAHEDRFFAARNSAIIGVFLSTGCRISEVSDLDASDYSAEDDSLLIRRTKSNRQLRVWLTPWAADRLNEWLALRGEEPGPIFITKKRGRMSTSAIHNMIMAVVKKAGIRERTTSHDFRRTFITRLLRADVDSFTVARLVNHKNVGTTMLYDRRSEFEDREAVNRLLFPEAIAHQPRSLGDGWQAEPR